jgi:hypothetical protein
MSQAIKNAALIVRDTKRTADFTSFSVLALRGAMTQPLSSFFADFFRGFFVGFFVVFGDVLLDIFLAISPLLHTACALSI